MIWSEKLANDMDKLKETVTRLEVMVAGYSKLLEDRTQKAEYAVEQVRKLEKYIDDIDLRLGKYVDSQKEELSTVQVVHQWRKNDVPVTECPILFIVEDRTFFGRRMDAGWEAFAEIAYSRVRHIHLDFPSSEIESWKYVS